MTTDQETTDPELERQLREIRALPEPEFARELDERVAAGFGGARSSRPETASTWKRVRRRVRLVPPRRALSGALGAAFVCIALATVVVSVTNVGGGDEEGQSVPTLQDRRAEPAPMTRTAPPPPAGDEAEALLESTEALASPQADVARSPIGLNDAGLGQFLRQSTGPFASDRNRRSVERSAEITLGTEAAQVREVSDEVFGVVGRFDGIVLSSSIQDGPEGEAGARFDLLIPSGRLSDALTDLSEIAEVRSREETSLDITAPTVTTQERLQDARAEVEGLLNQLADADTDSERAAVKQQLAFQRSRVAGLRSSLSRLERRANLSRVSLQVVTGEAAAFPGGSEDDEWTLGDAVHDAGEVLSTAAGVTLVGLAVLAPFAIIALLGWLARRAWVRQSRERALEA